MVNVGAEVTVVTGLTAIYLALSLFVTIITEYLAYSFNLRGRALRVSMSVLVDSPEVISASNSNPLIAPLFDDNAAPPSYINPNVFITQILYVIGENYSRESISFDLIRSIESLEESNFRQSLLGIAMASRNDVIAFAKNAEIWLDQSLIMLGEEYKRRIRVYSLLIGLTIAVAFNFDTIRIVTELYDEAARESAASIMSWHVKVRVDERVIDRCRGLTMLERRQNEDCLVLNSLEAASAEGGQVQLPFGWSGETKKPLSYLNAVGWLLTALAASLGATFWFDTLNRFVNIRFGADKPEPEKG